MVVYEYMSDRALVISNKKTITIIQGQSFNQNIQKCLNEVGSRQHRDKISKIECNILKNEFKGGNHTNKLNKGPYKVYEEIPRICILMKIP